MSTTLKTTTGMLIVLSLAFCYLLSLLSVSKYIIALTGLFLLPACLFLTNHIKASYYNQTRNIAVLLEALVDEDYNIRSAIRAEDDEMLEIKQLLNTLSQRLAQQNVAIKESQLLLEKVITHIDVGIIATDVNYDITFANPAANELLGLQSSQQGANLSCTTIPVEQVTRQPQSFTIKDGAVSKTYRIAVVKYIHHQQLNYLFFISDVQWLLIDKERESWQRLHRVLSHEVNNSLAPISSISATLLKQLQKLESATPALEQGLTVIHNRSTSLYKFISNFQKISKLPQPNKQPLDICELIEKCILLFPDSKISLLNPTKCQLYADPHQLEQVFVNLLKNAQEAMSTTTGEITIEFEQSDKYCSIKIIDEGVGISNTDNLFIPFFSTKVSGSGIGLVFSRQILFNHLGDLQIQNRNDKKGAVAVVSLPRLQS
ncbi:PAS domain-containing protein [Pseudoalteromonas piscicida]|uniref:sensor histidine kinase n=2 Tax=Pseudoalteromonas TaxID=53246 RepID=UPI001D0BD951|nr:ATP-binding protein [Pseudoalteromonas piscicida]UDM62597.1 PAS domain-containing protein [Pseudoalteromonas piscicida]